MRLVHSNTHRVLGKWTRVLRAVLEHCMHTYVCVEVNEGEASGDHLALADTHLLNEHQQGETG